MQERQSEQIMDEEKRNKIVSKWPREISYIQHDLAGLAMNMRIDNNELKEALPELLKGYQLAVRHKLLEPRLKNVCGHLLKNPQSP